MGTNNKTERIYSHTRPPLLKTAFGSFGLKISAAGFGFISSILLARILGPKELGIYTVIIATVNLAAAAVALGLPAFVGHETAKLHALENWGLLKGLIRLSHLWIAIAFLSTLAITAGFFFGHIVQAQLPWKILAFSITIIPLTAFSQLRSAILRGLHWIIIADIPELLLRPVLILLMLGSVYLSLNQADATQAITIQLLATLSSFLLGYWLMLSRIPQPVKNAAPQVHANKWAKETLPFFWISMAGLLEGQIGIYLLAYLTGPEQVGLFQVASQPVSMVIMGLVAVNLSLQPKLAAAWAKSDRILAQQLVTDAAKLGTYVALASAVILIPLAHLILQLYGDQYQDAVHALRILVLGQLINAATGPCGLVLSATGQQRRALYAIALALGINIAVILLLTPLYQATGVAIAAMIGLLVRNGLQVYFSRKYLNINTSIFLPKKTGSQ